MSPVNICLLGDARSIHLQRISMGLAQRGVSVRVVTHKPIAIAGVVVETFQVPPTGWTNLRGWSARRSHYLRGLFRKSDIVHVHFLADWGLNPEIQSEGCLAVTPWGSDITPPIGEGAPSDELLTARRGLLQNAQLITAWGPRFAEAIAQFASISLSRVQMMPLGVDTALFRRMHQFESESNDRMIVGFFKGFRCVYGAPVFVRAMPRIAEAVPGVRFCMIGDGAELESCQRLASDLGVDRLIEWVPRQPHHGLPRHLEQWQVSVIPSLQESFGLAALEASAMELPVVASDVGGLSDVVRHGETGRLVAPGDAGALADAVVALLGDANERQRLASRGRDMVKRGFEWGRIMDRWIETYARLREERCVMV